MALLWHTLAGALGLYSRAAPTQAGGYRLARFARRFRARCRWRDVFTTPHGPRLDLDLGIYPDCCMALGLYELTTARLLRRLLGPGGHFVDAGANLGYYTLLAAQHVGPAGRVDAIEPEPDNYRRLLANLERNGSPPQVQAHPVALADQPGEAAIHAYPDADTAHNHGCASLFPEPGYATTVRTVSTVRLDDLLDGATPRLIKLDVEGAELLAIEGMTRLLQSPTPPALIVEHNPPLAQHAGTNPDAWLRRVLALQPAYRPYVIGWRLRPLTAGSPRSVPPHQANLLLRCA